MQISALFALQSGGPSLNPLDCFSFKPHLVGRWNKIAKRLRGVVNLVFQSFVCIKNVHDYCELSGLQEPVDHLIMLVLCKSGAVVVNKFKHSITMLC